MTNIPKDHDPLYLLWHDQKIVTNWWETKTMKKALIAIAVLLVLIVGVVVALPFLNLRAGSLLVARDGHLLQCGRRA